MSAIQGAISPLFASVFDEEWRTTGCAFSYSIGNGLSGAAPMLALTVVHFHPVYGLGLLLMGLLLVGVLGMFLVHKIQHN